MPKKLVEAALFMSSRPLSIEEVSKITGVPTKNVQKILEDLRKEYEKNAKGIEIICLPDGWQMRVKPELLPKVAHLTPYSDLKEGHKRTLALVAYKEPIKQSEVVRIQGNKAYNYIKFLRKKGLIKAEKEGRTIKLSLTKEFERYLGIDRTRIKNVLQEAVKMDKAKEVKETDKEKEIQIKKEGEMKGGMKIEVGNRIKNDKLENISFNISKSTSDAYAKTMKPETVKMPSENETEKMEGLTKPFGKDEVKDDATKVEITKKETIKQTMVPEIKTSSRSLKRTRRKRVPPAAKIGTKRPK
jgi:segregation and condensation protein B